MDIQHTSSEILMDEHTAVLSVLDLQDRALVALDAGKSVDAGIFSDLFLFFSLFVGKCHHGKEEQLVFPALRRSPTLVAPIERLEQEHVEGGRLVAAYHEAEKQYAGDGMAGAAALATAARAYARFLRSHIEGENRDVLERAGTVTSAEEETVLVAAFDRFEDDVMGKGTHAKLHAMIDTLGPRIEALA